MKTRILIAALFAASLVGATDLPENLKDKDFVFEIMSFLSGNYTGWGDGWKQPFAESFTVGLDDGEDVIIFFRDDNVNPGDVKKTDRSPTGYPVALGVSSTMDYDVSKCENWSDSGEEEQLTEIGKHVYISSPPIQLSASGTTCHLRILRIALKSGRLTFEVKLLNNKGVVSSSTLYTDDFPALGDGNFSLRSGMNYMEMRFNVLRRNVHPPTIKTTMDFFNGINRFVPFSDFIEGPAADTITAREDQAHPSVIRTAYTNGEFQVMLGTNPIDETGEALYTLTATNGYGTSTAQVHLRLFSASIKINSAANGSVDPSGVVGGAPGDTLEITATPSSNYMFDGWDGDVSTDHAADNPLTLTFPETAQISITPKFKVKPYVETYTVSLDFNPSEGYLTTTVGEEKQTYTELPGDALEFEKNTVVKLSAKPKLGYVFKQWIGDVSVAQYQSPDISVIVTKDMTFGAVFEKDDSVSTTATSYDVSKYLPAPTAAVSDSSPPAVDSELLKLLADRRSSTVTGASAFTPSSGERGFGATKENVAAYNKALSSFGLSNSMKTENGSSSSSFSVRRGFKEEYLFKYQPYQRSGLEDGGEAGGGYYYSNDEVESLKSFYTPVESLFNMIFPSGTPGDGRMGH